MRVERVPLGCRVGVELVLQVLRDGRTSLALEGRLRKRFFLLSPLDLVPVRTQTGSVLEGTGEAGDVVRTRRCGSRGPSRRSRAYHRCEKALP